MQEKGNGACGFIIMWESICMVSLSLNAGIGKLEIYFPKIGFMDSKWSNLKLGVLFSACRKREMLRVDI